MKFSAAFPIDLDLISCELSYMTELKALMPKSAECDKIFKKCQNCQSV